MSKNQKLPPLLAVVTLLGFLFSCASSNRWNKEISWPDFLQDSLPSAQDYPDEGAVILLDEGNADMYNSGELSLSILERHTIIKIFDQRGYNFANVTIPYSASTEIADIKARTISKEGKIIPLSENQIFDVTLYPSFIFYSDVRAKRFTLPAVEPGCVIEYRWRAQMRNFAYRDQWSFQNEAPTMLSRYQIKVPSEWDFKWKTIGIDLKPRTTKVPVGFKQNYLWEARNLPALVPEVGMPPAQHVSASILLSPYGIKNWSEVAHWYHALISDRLKPDARTREKALKLAIGCATEREKLERIFTFVRDNVRYVAIAIGIGGYQPHYAADVCRNLYGDCKDKVTLMISMASAVGINVEPVLISTWQNGTVDTTIASPTHFNHLIAHATLPDSTTIWMDATETSCAFDHLPWYDQGRQVVAVTSQGEGIWLSTPQDEAVDNLLQRTWKMQIDSAGHCQVTQDVKLSGASAMEARDQISLARQDEIKNWIFRPVLSRFPGAELDDVAVYDRAELNMPLHYSCKFTWTLSKADTNSVIPLSIESFSQFDWQKLFAEKERKFPLLFQYPMGIVDSVSINFADNWSVVGHASNDSLSNQFGQYILNWNQQLNRRLCISRKFQINETDIPATEYPKIREFLNAVALQDRKASLILQRKR